MQFNPRVIRFILRVGYYYRDANGKSSGYYFGNFFNIGEDVLFDYLQEMQLMGLIDFFNEIDLTHQFGYSTFEYRLSKKGEYLIEDYNKLIDFLNNLPQEIISGKLPNNVQADDKHLQSTDLNKTEAAAPEIILNSDLSCEIKFLPVSVDRDSRIKVGRIELPLTPLYKTLYIFYLNHLEGVKLKDLSDFKIELAEIYRRICPSDNISKIDKSIDNLVNPHDCSFSQKKSKINKIISSRLDKSLAEFYKITGERGGVFKINLSAGYIDINY